MTYYVLSGTLNPTYSMPSLLYTSDVLGSLCVALSLAE